MSLDKMLKKLRKERGITQQELAQYTGLSFASIGSYEKGLRQPNAKAMRALENYFCVSAEYLYGETDVNSYYQDEEKEFIRGLINGKLEQYITYSSKCSKSETQTFNSLLLSTFNLILNIISDFDDFEDVAQDEKICEKWFECYEAMSNMDSSEFKVLINIMYAYCKQDKFKRKQLNSKN
ncbi:MAG: helix-turn-helix domain-containing protein [Ruminiclostridium sp.]